jgi:fermentation-respiration switch protein FrsA (DUF1100 family)
MKQTLFYISVSVALIWYSGCLDIDSFMFNQKKFSSYSLSTVVIPESSRTQVTMVSQGRNIYGYFVHSNRTRPQVTVLYNHGNRDNLQFYWDRVELLYKMGFNVFIYDYEGFGMSEGEPNEHAMYSDAEAALEHILSRSDVDTSKIAIYGFSLGCAAAVNIAATSFVPRVLVLEAPFASSMTLVQSGTLLDIPSSYVMKGEYNNAEKIKGVHVPLLIMHGENDTFIDIDKNSQVIYDNANKPKVFIRVPNANHSEIPEKMGEQKYLFTVSDFILNPPSE